jgi:hypothetical protein
LRAADLPFFSRNAYDVRIIVVLHGLFAIYFTASAQLTSFASMLPSLYPSVSHAIKSVPALSSGRWQSTASCGVKEHHYYRIARIAMQRNVHRLALNRLRIETGSIREA